MGRAFEYRKARKMKRWDHMAKVFTKLGKEITMAVKSGSSDPDTNARLRSLIQNARAENMPKDRVDAAIKRATEKDTKAYEEIIYEGYAPHGIAVLVETATDNPVRTVANVRMYFNRAEGSLGTSGSVGFLFEHKASFKIAKNNLAIDDLELELIDFGAEEVLEDTEENSIFISCQFNDFGTLQKHLEEQKIEIISSEISRIPSGALIALNDEEKEDVLKLIDKLEQDEDVQNVYHNLLL